MYIPLRRVVLSLPTKDETPEELGQTVMIGHADPGTSHGGSVCRAANGTVLITGFRSLVGRAFQCGLKSFDSIRFDSRYRIDFFDSIKFGNLINVPLVH